MKVSFVNFNGIKDYARVMYNDVKEADKKRIEVMYNGQDIKDLLEYLFDLEQRIDKAIEYLEESIDIIKGDSMIPISSGNVRRRYLKPVLEILKGEDK